MKPRWSFRREKMDCYNNVERNMFWRMDEVLLTSPKNDLYPLKVLLLYPVGFEQQCVLVTPSKKIWKWIQSLNFFYIYRLKVLNLGCRLLSEQCRTSYSFRDPLEIGRAWFGWPINAILNWDWPFGLQLISLTQEIFLMKRPSIPWKPSRNVRHPEWCEVLWQMVHDAAKKMTKASETKLHTWMNKLCTISIHCLGNSRKSN